MGSKNCCCSKNLLLLLIGSWTYLTKSVKTSGGRCCAVAQTFGWDKLCPYGRVFVGESSKGTRLLCWAELVSGFVGFGSPAAVAAVDGVAGEIGLWDGLIPVERVGSQRVVAAAVVAGITPLLIVVKSSQVVGLRIVVEMLNLGMDEMLVLRPLTVT